MPGTTLPIGGDEPQPYRAAVKAARGLAGVEVAGLPVDAQAAWARMCRPVLQDLLEAADPAGGGLVVGDPVTMLLTAVGDAATALADLWREAGEDRAARWCAVALAEQITALLRSDHPRALDIANEVNRTVEEATVVDGGAL